jgi:hypothetical protein
MPASNVEIKSVVLSDLAEETEYLADGNLEVSLSGTIELLINDTGVLPTAGNVKIDSIYFALDEYGKLDIMDSISLSLGITPVFGIVKKERQFAVSAKSGDESEDNMVDLLIEVSNLACIGEPMPIYVDYTVNGLLSSASYEEQQVEVKLTDKATGDICEGL